MTSGMPKDGAPRLQMRRRDAKPGVRAANVAPLGCRHLLPLPACLAGEGPVHDPEVYLFDYVPPELRIEVHSTPDRLTSCRLPRGGWRNSGTVHRA